MAFWDGILDRRAEELGAPVSGEAITLSEVKDEAFGRGMLGGGIAIIPDGGRIAAPCAGKVETVFETGHALTFTTQGGVQALIHVGIDTVRLGGQHFCVRCTAGKPVRKGQLLLEFDREAIGRAGYDTTVVMVLPEERREIQAVTGKRVDEGETVIRLAAR